MRHVAIALAPVVMALAAVPASAGADPDGGDFDVVGSSCARPGTVGPEGNTSYILCTESG